jgi:hypothetical protein
MARASKSKKTGVVKVSFKGVESRKNVQEGDYPCVVLEAKEGKSSNGNDQIEFVVEISKGENKGYKGYLYCPLQENSLWKLHAFLTACGEEVPDDEMDIDLSEIEGKEFMGVFTHETYNGKKRAKLTDFDSMENYSGDADDEKPAKGKKKDKKSKDESEEKSSKKDKSKKDEPEAKAGKKDKKKDKGAKAEKVKKYDADDIDDMDEDELAEVVKKAKLKVDLDGIKKLPKKVSAVRDALEAADLLND